MDYETLLSSLRETLSTRQAEYQKAIDRSASLGSEYEKAKTLETKLSAEVERTRASIRAVEFLVQSQNAEEGN